MSDFTHSNPNSHSLTSLYQFHFSLSLVLCVAQNHGVPNSITMVFNKSPSLMAPPPFVGSRERPQSCCPTQRMTRLHPTVTHSLRFMLIWQDSATLIQNDQSWVHWSDPYGQCAIKAVVNGTLRTVLIGTFQFYLDFSTIFRNPPSPFFIQYGMWWLRRLPRTG